MDRTHDPFATQIYETVDRSSLTDVVARFKWSVVKIYEIDAPGQNHGLVLGAIRWQPPGLAALSD